MRALPLENFWQAQGAHWIEEQGWKIPASFAGAELERASLTQTCGLTDQSHRGKILVTGNDRTAFLNNMLTNDIRAIADGSGKRTLLLSAQGKCLADFRVFAFENSLLLDTEPGLAADAIKLLAKFIITDDVILNDNTFDMIHLSFDGPQSPALFSKLKALFTFGHTAVLDRHASLSGMPAVHLFIRTGDTAATAEKLKILDLTLCGHAAFEQVRLAQRIPRFKIDFDENWFLNETGLDKTAASETKGCYPGQEVVAKINTYKKMAPRIFK